MTTTGSATAAGETIAPGLTGLRELGGGSMYEAWLSFDERLHAPVVVKRVRQHLRDDAAAMNTYRRELEIMSSLSHPGIARLFSYDDECEQPYLVIEHIDGPTLSRLIASHGRLPDHQLLPLIVDLCSALHYLHGSDLVHLDLKPSNIVMGAPAKLIDFSIALSTADAAELDHPVGSDEYMAPEQCEPGVRGQMGPASDVWGMAASVFRAAAGYRAFDRESKWAQLHAEPKGLPSYIDPAIGRLLADCLVHDPAARPTPLEVIDRVDPLLANLPRARLSGFSIKL